MSLRYTTLKSSGIFLRNINASSYTVGACNDECAFPCLLELKGESTLSSFWEKT